MNSLEILYDANGSLWAAFVIGHVKPQTVFTEVERARIAQEADTHDTDLSTVLAPQLFHLRRQDNLRGCDYWVPCHADAPGAVAVTGVLFE